MQVLNKGFCTILFNRLIIDKVTTLKMKGGNSEIEYGDNGRLKRAEGLQALWPNIFEIKIVNSQARIKPSRIWKTFKQRPIKGEIQKHES
jgi:hypothetical protein